jgi:hydroxypyruvate isomerase
MPRFAANLSFTYGEHAFMARFAAAARDGFRAVEFAFAYEHDRYDLAARLSDHGLVQGELRHPYRFALFDDLGYNGHIGCEYRPAAGTSAGLGWFERYKNSLGDKL